MACGREPHGRGVAERLSAKTRLPTWKERMLGALGETPSPRLRFGGGGGGAGRRMHAGVSPCLADRANLATSGDKHSGLKNRPTVGQLPWSQVELCTDFPAICCRCSRTAGRCLQHAHHCLLQLRNAMLSEGGCTHCVWQRSCKVHGICDRPPARCRAAACRNLLVSCLQLLLQQVCLGQHIQPGLVRETPLELVSNLPLLLRREQWQHAGQPGASAERTDFNSNAQAHVPH